MAYVQEWLPPTVRTLTGQSLFGLAALLVALLVVSRYRPTLEESLRLLLFGVLGLTAVRNVIWFGMVAAPVLAACLRSWELERRGFKAPRPGRAGLNAAFAALVVLLAALSLPWLRPYLPLAADRLEYVSPDTPLEAAESLRGLPQPLRAFHSDGYGSYMIWASPEVPVFIDPRLDLYPPAQWSDYLALAAARYDWEAILARYDVNTLLLDRERMPRLVEAAAASANWQTIYEDEQAVILKRRGGP